MGVRLAYRPPYDWGQVSGFLAARAVPGVERVDERGYARTVATDDGPLIVRVGPLAGDDALELSVTGAVPVALDGLASDARRTFGLAVDPERVGSVLQNDPLLAPLVLRRPGLRVVGTWSPFECAVRAVLGQQVTVIAGRTFAARLVARVGASIALGTDGLTHVFPSPEAIAHANLDGLGLTGMRIGALRALARAVIEGSLDFAAPVDQTAARLAALPGFGSWTAHYVALRALDDADAMPTGDLVLRRMAGGDTALSVKALQARAEAWRPWRGYATFHLWRAAAEGR